MKKRKNLFFAFATFFFVLAFSTETYAQRRNRGNSSNRSTASRGSATGSQSRATTRSTNRGSRSSSTARSTNRGSSTGRVNRGSRSGNVNRGSRSSSGRATTRGSSTGRVNRGGRSGNGHVNRGGRGTVHRAPRSGRPGRHRVGRRGNVPHRVYSNYGRRGYFRPYRTHRRGMYVYRHHSPYLNIWNHTIFWNPYSYSAYVLRLNRRHFYRNWIFFYHFRTNGYFVHNGYPYYSYNHYRHRYSRIDTCSYQLVDKCYGTVIKTYWNQYCNVGYDRCADLRDRLNRNENDYRFSCAETHRSQSYQYFNTRDTSYLACNGSTDFDDHYYDDEYDHDNDYGNYYETSSNSNNHYNDDLYDTY